MKYAVFALKVLILVALVALLVGNVDKPQVEPTPQQVEQLKADMEQLRVDMEDVRNVQGYMAWETDWRNRERQKGASR